MKGHGGERGRRKEGGETELGVKEGGEKQVREKEGGEKEGGEIEGGEKEGGAGEFFHRNFSLGFSNMKGFGAFVRIQLDPIIIR